MGVPKRKVSGGRDGAAAPAGAAKRARTEELTGVSFKAQLRDPQGAGPGECREGKSASFCLRGASVCRRSSSFLQRGSKPSLPICSRETETWVPGIPGPRFA